MDYYNIIFIIMLIMLFAIMYGMSKLKSRGFKYSKRVLIALVVGILFGLFIHVASGTETTTIKWAAEVPQEAISSIENASTTLSNEDQSRLTQALLDQGALIEKPTATGYIVQLLDIVSGLYIALLQLLVIPLILVSISTAIIDGRKNLNTGRKIIRVITMLMITVAIAAVIGIIFTLLGGSLVDATNITPDVSSEMMAKSESLNEKTSMLNSMSISDFVLAPIPTNFGFLVGIGSSAALSTVLFGMFLGYSVNQVDKRKPEKVKPFIDFLYSIKEIVLSMVLETLKLTPYAVVALMAVLVATTSLSSLGVLLVFVVMTYLAIFTMYIIHLIFISSVGLSPKQYAKKTWEVLLFGFTSRSSMAALPLNISTQVEKLGVDESTANISGSFGVTIGQNGCAGIYPAMVVVMTWLYMGHEITVLNIISLIIVIMISSFGIAGVGGGASFAAVAVLSIMGLPIQAAAVLIAIESLLDMARTALNISGSMTTGVVVSKVDKDLDEEVYNA